MSHLVWHRGERISQIKNELQLALLSLEETSKTIHFSEAMKRLDALQPCLKIDCKEYKLGEVLLGFDRHWHFWSLSILLLVYNFCRFILTLRVGPLRDESDMTGHAPRLKGFGGYGWLKFPHRVVNVLFWISIFSLSYHLWDWLFQTTVWLPLK